MNSNRMRNTFHALVLYVFFQVAVSAGYLLASERELAGLSKLQWLVGWLSSWKAYANPIGISFVYLASIKWLIVDRQVQVGWTRSVAYYAIFGLYYGALFMNNLNGELHGEFDRVLGINPGPLVSAMFPLSLAFVLPFAMTLLLSITFVRQRKTGEPVG